LLSVYYYFFFFVILASKSFTFVYILTDLFVKVFKFSKIPIIISNSLSKFVSR